ncbi:MAG: metal-dependent hydrolase [Bryobacteraceae bacterium]
MFLGHLAVGFAAKRAAPKTSLGVLLGASELIDLLFPAFILTGWEQVRFEAGDNPFLTSDFHYPFSHSLVMNLLWASGAALAYWLFTRYRTGSVVIGLTVLSHWVLDLISHKPDMPLYPGESPMLGLGLWYSVSGTIVVELLMLAAGVWVYHHISRARNRVGSIGLWLFVAVMLLLYVSMLLSPPPPDAKAFAWVGVAFVLFLLWAHWFDRQREVKLGHAL